MSPLTRPAIPILLVLLAGCASGVSSGGSSSVRNPNRISPEELAELPPGTAMDAVERLRPNWMQGRGSFSTTRTQTLPEVFVDERYHGSLQSLRQFDLDTLAEIRFLSGRDATTRYGTGYPGGIIQLVLKK